MTTDPSAATTADEPPEDLQAYYALIVDSGPIIRQTGLTSLRGKAQSYVTVPSVLEEIRDAKAREHLERLPFDLATREPTAEGMKAVTEFSRQTGDYQSLSNVDLQILALVYDMEKEGCSGIIDHVRTTPKRTVGVGKIQMLNNESKEADKAPQKTDLIELEEPNHINQETKQPDQKEKTDSQQKEETDEELEQEEIKGPKSWAMIVNVKEASKPSLSSIGTTNNNTETSVEPKISDKVLTTTFGQMNLGVQSPSVDLSGEIAGQFSDAESDEFDPMEALQQQHMALHQGDDESDDEGYAASDKEVSDEECDVYVLDPDEVKERQQAEFIKEELEGDFPSLSASLHVPYDGSDEDNNDEADQEITVAIKAKEKALEKSKLSLQPITKSGKMYNSFRKYGKLMKPKEVKPQPKNSSEKEMTEVPETEAVVENEYDEGNRDNHSRIIGGVFMSGQTDQVEDDGEGWVTSTKDIRKMKASGRLDPTINPSNLDQKKTKKESGPPISQRAACATTDFAMQNVILQMNLHLLSVDGMKIRKLKSWVHRCGACFKVYADNDNTGVYKKRLFCSHCGSDMIQRIAASVNGKTGKLRLHLSKKYQHNLRGTKFSLPKAGSGNRFQGDLLLREDQMLMSGAWNQRVKKASGGQARGAAPSMFGSDLATNVGCHANKGGLNDIRVGFGRRNPNASKGGRERRGKKKKNTDKACGLRRY